MLDKETRLSELWGTGKYVLYSVSNGQATAQYLGNGAEQEDAAFKEDDLVVAVKNGGEYSYVTASAGMTFGTDIVYAVKFLTPSAGQIGGKEVAIEAKETTIETLTEAKEEANSEKEKTELQNQINTTQQEINNLKNGTAESEGSYALMWEAVTTVLEIKTLEATVKSAQEDMAEAEQTFVDEMGNMLHDGYWNNSNYTVGQEESLYADAVEILKIMSRPAVTYSMSFLNLAALSDYKMEEIKLNMRIRIYDFELGVNDWGFIEKIVEYPLAERENTVTISTDELNISANTFESVLNRMMEAANIIDQRNAIYERAAAISEGGTISADQLNGEIDLLKNHLASTKSGWYTDANGNIMFEAQDGQSAMMLSGSGFMVANGKDASGNWNWRTFGTGEGFTADLITAGILRAGTITILGTDQFYWDADNIYIFDPSNPDRQIRIGKYDGTNYGIGYTTDNGETWQNAIGFDGVSLSASMTETISSLGDRVTEVESKVTPDAIVQMVTESETYQNEIGGLDQRISTAESKLTPEAMETTIENSEALSEVRQTADKINWIVESGTSSSNMTLTDDALSVISEGITLTADKINLVANDINLSGNSSVNTIVSNAVDPLETDIDSLTTRMTQAETSITQNTEAIELRATKEEVQTAQDTADFATPLTGAEPPEEAPAAGKLWIDDGQTPSVWRRWRGAAVPTDREYEETVSGNVDSPAFVSIDNTHGQLQTVALEAGCVAQQAGTGDPSPTNIRAISGRESVEVTACGKNLIDTSLVSDEEKNGITVTRNPDGSIRLEGTSTSILFINLKIHGGTIFRNIESAVFVNAMNSPKTYGGYTAKDVYIEQRPTDTYTRVYLYIVSGTNLDKTYYPQLELGSTATAYEPYTPMGGGTVTPSEPLYGLPDAKDTVDVDASGDVTVTRRTGYIASYNGESLPGRWISSHDVYAEGATPTTGAQVVYELAVPETEALTAITPITPEAGPVNIWTDADALTATVRGSGWEIINDTDGLSADIQEAQDDISGMVGSINTIENNISAMASQILTPDQIISTVVESTDFQTVSTQVIQTGEGLAIVQTTVDDLGDRVDVIEGAVVIEGANIDIGRSDSNTRLHLDNEG